MYIGIGSGKSSIKIGAAVLINIQEKKHQDTIYTWNSLSKSKIIAAFIVN